MTDILKTAADVLAYRQKNANQTLALIPTMGNLHAGHLSLIDIAKQKTEQVMVSIFVNPTQFAANEDLGSYPRTLEQDLQQLRQKAVSAVFCPDVKSIYPYGNDNTISIDMPAEMTQILCGISRPTHFQGVATVVAKLLQITQANWAVFGKKDYQQLAVIRRLVKELFINTEILSGKIIRESNGLAMSSRNQYLSEQEFEQAAMLYQTLTWCRQQLLCGMAIDATLKQGKERLHNVGITVDYLDFRDAKTLAEYPTLAQGVLLVAARLGRTRLIDNLSMEETQ